MASEVPHTVALALFYTMMMYFVFLIVRLLARRDWAAIAAYGFYHSLAGQPLFRDVLGAE